MTLEERDWVNGAADTLKGCSCCLEAARFALAGEMDPYRVRMAIAAIEGILEAQADQLASIADPDKH